MKTIESFKTYKENGKKISMITCYDYWSALIIDESNVDAVLVGDSSAMVMHGYKTTVNADVDMIAAHTAAVNRGIEHKFIITDLPFLSHLKGRSKLVETAEILFKAGSNALKLEGAENSLSDIEYLVKSGIPIMGHLGMTPQSVNKFGGFKLQGNGTADAKKIFEDAKRLQDAGCFSIVLEMIPSELASKITEQLSIPTIGIGAGPSTSGQILVLQDLLGLNKDFHPKFLRKYLNGYELIKNSLNEYDNDVKLNKFPSIEESY